MLLAFLIQTLTIMAGFVAASGLCWFVETILDHKNWHKDYRLLIKKIISMCLVLSSALFLLWEFRKVGSVVSGDKPELMSVVYGIRYALFQGYQILFGRAAMLGLFLSVIIAVIVVVADFRNLSAAIITATAITWQCYIYAFVYNNGGVRILTWLTILFFFVTAVSGDDKKSSFSDRALMLLMVFIIIFQWGYGRQPQIGHHEFEDMVMDLSPDWEFSSSKEMADFINELPDDVPIFVSDSDYDSPVVAQVREREIYNPFFWQ